MSGMDEFLKRSKKTLTKKKKEKSIEDEFCDHVKTKNCLPLKLILLRLRGWPDRSVLCPGGKVLFIEFKRSDKDKRSPQQDKWREVLIGFGFTYVTCHNLEDAKICLEDFLNDW